MAPQPSSVQSVPVLIFKASVVGAAKLNERETFDEKTWLNYSFLHLGLETKNFIERGTIEQRDCRTIMIDGNDLSGSEIR